MVSFKLVRTLTAYDNLGRKSRQVLLADPDSTNNIDNISLSVDKVTDFVYTAGKLERKKEIIGYTTSTTTFASTKYNYDDFGRIDEVLMGKLEEDSTSGAMVTEDTMKKVAYAYNDLGQKISETTTDFNTTDQTSSDFSKLYTYDPQGRVKTISNASGLLLTRDYDTLGRVIEEKDAFNVITKYAYDGLGNLVTKTEDVGGVTERVTTFTYDRNSRKTAITSGSDTTSYEYNYLNKVTKIDYPSSADIEYGYDLLGNIVSRKIGSETTHYICDAIGRVNYKQYSNSENWNGLDTSIAFDEFLYDAAGRRKIVSHVDQNGTDTEINTYTYADLSKMTIADEQNGTTEYGYDQRGLIASIKYPSDNYAIYAHDALGRVTEVSYPDTNTTIASYDYLGNRIIGKTFANANLKYEVALDSLGRITAETIKKISPEDTLKTNSYTYAANTNRLGSRNGLSYTYNNLGQLVGAGTSTYEFDVLGNPTNTVDDNLTYTKNKEDRITEVKDAQNTVLADYQYDAAGRRAKKTVNSVATSFVYGLNGAVLSEISGSTAREYVYGTAGEVIYMHRSAGSSSGRYLVTDFRNSVIAKAYYDGNQVQIDYIDYNAWGEPTVSQGGDLEGLSVLWNGYYYDDETGNYYLRNRYYSPQERNFITEDPRGINPSGNWNNLFAVHTQYRDGYGLMVYCQSDPVNGRDDWGLSFNYSEGPYVFQVDDDGSVSLPSKDPVSKGNDDSTFTGWEVHGFVGVGYTETSCKDECGKIRRFKFAKFCFGGAIGFVATSGHVAHFEGIKCRHENYEGWFYEAGLGVGPFGVGADFGYTGDSYPADLSGISEYGGGFGLSKGLKRLSIKSTWCTYAYLGDL